LPDADRARMGLEPNSEIAVLAVVTLPQTGDRGTANLQGPIVIDFTTRRGWQVIVADSEYGTRHSIDLPLRIPEDG
jgi:flagellar assembly factor FliW